MALSNEFQNNSTKFQRQCTPNSNRGSPLGPLHCNFSGKVFHTVSHCLPLDSVSPLALFTRVEIVLTKARFDPE